MAERGRSGTWIAGLLAALFALPMAALVVQAFGDTWRFPALFPQELGLRGFSDAFAGGGAGPALLVSIEVALLTTLLALVTAWPAARVLGERRLRHPAPVILILAAPLLVPPLATGVGLTEWFVRLGLIDSLAGLVLVHLVFVLPYAILVLSAGFGPRLRGLEEMSRSLGVGPVERLLHVTLPNVRPTLAAAALLAFLVSWAQYGSSLAIAGGRPTLPVVLLPYVGSDPQVAASLSLLFLAPALLALGLAVRAGRTG